MKTIYLDNAATTRPLPCALEAYQTAPFGNPSSEHAAGQAARTALEQAREKIAKCINAELEQIIFTSGSTEACNLAMNSMEWLCENLEISPFEHHAVNEEVCRAELKHWGKYEGGRKHNGIVHLLGNNETGELYPPKDSYLFSKNVLGVEIPWFTDATTVVGHIPVDVKQIDCTFMSFAAHKFGGVPGVGVLYAKDPSLITPMIYGGGQERGMRSGTENVPAICAMASALEWQVEHTEENTQKIAAMRQMLFQSISRIENHKWNTPFNSLPHILNVSFDGVDGHALALLLSKEGVMVSAGAACSNGKNEPSHVIMAMFGDEARARSAIRISLSHENTPDECVEAAKKIEEAVLYLRSLN